MCDHYFSLGYFLLGKRDRMAEVRIMFREGLGMVYTSPSLGWEMLGSCSGMTFCILFLIFTSTNSGLPSRCSTTIHPTPTFTITTYTLTHHHPTQTFTIHSFKIQNGCLTWVNVGGMPSYDLCKDRLLLERNFIFFPYCTRVCPNIHTHANHARFDTSFLL